MLPYGCISFFVYKYARNCFCFVRLFYPPCMFVCLVAAVIVIINTLLYNALLKLGFKKK